MKRFKESQAKLKLLNKRIVTPTLVTAIAAVGCVESAGSWPPCLRGNKWGVAPIQAHVG